MVSCKESRSDFAISTAASRPWRVIVTMSCVVSAASTRAESLSFASLNGRVVTSRSLARILARAAASTRFAMPVPGQAGEAIECLGLVATSPGVTSPATRSSATRPALPVCPSAVLRHLGDVPDMVDPVVCRLADQPQGAAVLVGQSVDRPCPVVGPDPRDLSEEARDVGLQLVEHGRHGGIAVAEAPGPQVVQHRLEGRV